jgi:Phosphorylase superfamily
MLEVVKNATQGLELKSESNGVNFNYTPGVYVGGNGVSGPTFVDNAKYRSYVNDEFQALCLDMETAAAAHIAYQNNIPVLFFRSLSDLAGADQDGNVMGVFFAVAAENAFTVLSAFIEALYPQYSVDGVVTEAPTTTGGAPTTTALPTTKPRASDSGVFKKQYLFTVVGCLMTTATIFC